MQVFHSRKALIELKLISEIIGVSKNQHKTQCPEFKMDFFLRKPHLGFRLVVFQFRKMYKHTAQHSIEKFNNNKSRRNPRGLELSGKSNFQDTIIYTALALNECPFTFRWLKLRRNYFMMGLRGVKPNSICKINYLLFHLCCHSNWHNKHPLRTEKCWKFHSSDRFLEHSSFFRIPKFPIPHLLSHEFANILKLTLRSNRLKNGWCVKMLLLESFSFEHILCEISTACTACNTRDSFNHIQCHVKMTIYQINTVWKVYVIMVDGFWLEKCLHHVFNLNNS